MSSINVLIILQAQQRMSRQGVGIGLWVQEISEISWSTSVRQPAVCQLEDSPLVLILLCPSVPLAFTKSTG